MSSTLFHLKMRMKIAQPGIALHNNLNLSLVFHSYSLEMFVLLRQNTLESYRWWHLTNPTCFLVLFPAGSAFTLSVVCRFQELFWASQLLGRDTMSHELYGSSFWGGTCQHLTTAATPSNPIKEEVLICFNLFIPIISPTFFFFFFKHAKLFHFRTRTIGHAVAESFLFTLENACSSSWYQWEVWIHI